MIAASLIQIRHAKFVTSFDWFAHVTRHSARVIFRTEIMLP
jgi:hypothetical protein